jgi:hypothetical protein
MPDTLTALQPGDDHAVGKWWTALSFAVYHLPTASTTMAASFLIAAGNEQILP